MGASGDVNRADGDGLLRLGSRRLELVLAPGLGGSISRLDLVWLEGRMPLLRGVNGMPEEVREAACFPLVPSANRIRSGRFAFRGRDIRLAPNLDGEPLPIHGQGLNVAWDVESAAEREAVLVFRHPPGEWPWAYEARQYFRLEEAALELALSCRNLSDAPMPCGLGLHPYFGCDVATRFDAHVEAAWTGDADALPADRVPAEGRFDLRDRALCGANLDHCFEGWSGRARIRSTAPVEIAVASDAAFLHVYAPAGKDFFAAEPVTHRPAALNEPEEAWPEAGLRVLAPGEETSLTMRIEAQSA